MAAISAVWYVNAIIVTEIFCDSLKHHAEEDSEESWREDAALLHPIVVVSDLTTLIFMQLHDHAEKLWKTA